MGDTERNFQVVVPDVNGGIWKSPAADSWWYKRQYKCSGVCNIHCDCSCVCVCVFHLRNDLYCVGWGVKLYPSSASIVGHCYVCYSTYLRSSRQSGISVEQPAVQPTTVWHYPSTVPPGIKEYFVWLTAILASTWWLFLFVVCYTNISYLLTHCMWVCVRVFVSVWMISCRFVPALACRRSVRYSLSSVKVSRICWPLFLPSSSFLSLSLLYVLRHFVASMSMLTLFAFHITVALSSTFMRSSLLWWAGCSSVCELPELWGLLNNWL